MSYINEIRISLLCYQYNFKQMMKKKLFLTSAFILLWQSGICQVGINNSAPKATLDVTAKAVDGSTAEGIIAPRMTGDQLKLADAKYAADQAGVIVYVTAPVTTSSAKTVNVTSVGYFYFNGTIWVKLGTDTTDDAWINATGVVKLNTLADGITTRTDNNIISFSDNGHLGLGIENPFTGITILSQGITSALDSSIAILRFADSGSLPPSLIFNVGRGGLYSAKNSQSGDIIFDIQGAGYTKNGAGNGGQTRFKATYLGDGNTNLSDLAISTSENVNLYINPKGSIGVRTVTPKASLDIATNTDTTVPVGVLPPRLTGNELKAKDAVYSTDQAGAMVYITAPVTVGSTKTANITNTGYYYFDGTVWQNLQRTVAFTASTGAGVGSQINATITKNNFQTVPLLNVGKNIGGGTWDSTNYTYKVPVSGTYLIKSTIRLTDATATGSNSSTNRNIYQVVQANINSDIPDGIWQTNLGGRWTMLFSRIAYFNKDDLLRLVCYSDGVDAYLSDASLNIVLLNQN